MLWIYVREYCRNMFICNMNSNIGYHILKSLLDINVVRLDENPTTNI